jgi:hypothetical protein
MGFEDNPYPIHLVEVGGVFFYSLIIQKQVTHGAESMGFTFFFSFTLFFTFAFSSPNSQPSSLREKGPSLR